MTLYLTGNPTSLTTGDLPAQLNRMDFLRRRDYRDWLRFYYGYQWPAQRINQKRRRLVFNYAKTLIEKVTSYLMVGRSITVDPDNDSRAARKRADGVTEYLRQLNEDLDLDLLDFDNELDCSILGDAAYKVTWDPALKRPDVVCPDVTGLFAWWQPDNLKNLWRVATQYSLDSQQISDLYGLTLDQRQPSQKITEAWTEDSFRQWIGARLVRDEVNPYGFIPIVIYPNLRKPHQFWGESDIANIKESVQELNREMSQLSAIMEVSGNPIAVLEGITEAKDIAVEPGAVWEIPEASKAYVLDLIQHGGMQAHFSYIDVLYRTLHDLGESPRTAFGGAASPNIAALAMQLDLDPIIKKVRRKQLIRTVAYKNRAEMMLRLSDQYHGTHYWPCRLRVTWLPIMPQDRSRDAETDAILVDRAIISRETAAKRAGVKETDDELARWVNETGQVQAIGGVAPAGKGLPRPATGEPHGKDVLSPP